MRSLAPVGRLARDLPGFLRRGIDGAAAVVTVRHRLATREGRFLDLARRGIYAYAASPFRPLLAAAGCELGDLETLVATEGLEAALCRLAAAGVRVTFDDFKRRSAAFSNPLVPVHLEARSGGTRGTGTSMDVGLPFIADLAMATRLALDAHGLGDAEHAVWVITGVNPMLLYAKLGRAPVGWFYPVRPLPATTRVVAGYLAALARLGGHRLPLPRFCDVRDPGRLAQWLADRAPRHRRICLTTYASSAVRIANAARERGLSLDHVTFVTIGEPFTAAKGAAIAAAGASALVRFAVTELGILGFRCAHPRGPDDLHFFSDAHALVQHPRVVGDGGPSVRAFLFTSLLDSAPKILLNVETGDYGEMEQRACDCRLGALGLTTHVERIRSFEKLSSEGTTFVHTDLLRVLEEVLPARFSGSGEDYQVLETEGAEGFLQVELIVSPRVGAVDAAEVREVFLTALGDGGVDRLRAGIWRGAGTVRVTRRWPMATRAGKILPFHLARGADGLPLKSWPA